MVEISSTRRVCYLANVLRRLATASNTCRTFNKSSIVNISHRTSSTGCNPTPTSHPHLPLGRVIVTPATPSPSSDPPASSYIGQGRKWKTSGVAAIRTSSALLLGQPSVRSLPLTHAMAAYAYSTSSSDISTPRSISPPASVISGRSSQSSISHKRMSISSRRISASNPMSSVDISTIEEAMKMANLDTLRGYSQNHYGQVQQYANTEYISQSQAAGYQVLREPLWNKGKLKVPKSYHSLGSVCRCAVRSKSISSYRGPFRLSPTLCFQSEMT
jgi:hypothetical protein